MSVDPETLPELLRLAAGRLGLPHNPAMHQLLINAAWTIERLLASQVQSIDKAPKDGTQVVLFERLSEHCHWDSKKGVWLDSASEALDADEFPSHFCYVSKELRADTKPPTLP